MHRYLSLVGMMVVLAVAACAPIDKAEPPQVSLADFKLLPGGLFEQKFQLELRVTNPNNFDLPLEGLSFKLALNDKPFAQGASSESVTVPRLGEARIPVVASTTVLDIMQQVLALGRSADLTYRLEGLAYLSGLGRRSIPYVRDGKLQLLPGPSGAEQRLVPL
jgi:LEA14-like dessication related protein